MNRSLHKGPYVSDRLIQKVFVINRKRKKNKKVILTWSRASTVVPTMIGHTLGVHNGRIHIPVFITDQMVGHKLGEFSPTRKFRGHIKKNKRLKK